MTLAELLHTVRTRPLPAAPPSIIAPRVWPSVAYARADMTYSLNLACCAALCSALRNLSARIRAEAPTPPQGFPVQQ